MLRRSDRWIVGGLGFLILALVGAYGEQQPIPYSHKAHLALGLKCNSCHKNADPGEAMGLPAESFCMNCHQAVKTESPHIQALAAAARAKKAVEWVRVYALPSFVYFSHRVHGKGGVSCESCHGPVREREVITKEVVHTMKNCMACHTEMKAKNECTTCHEEK